MSTPGPVPTICQNQTNSSNPNPVCIRNSPYICGQKRPFDKITVPTDVEGCDMWNIAIQRMNMNIGSHISGNYNNEIASCYRIPKDQVETYGKDDIFDIKALKKNWAGDSSGSSSAVGNINCQRTAYGIFNADGTKVLSSQTNMSDSYAYWANMQATCMVKPDATTLKDPKNNKSLYRCYTNPNDPSSSPIIPDGGCVDPYDQSIKINSMLEDYQDHFSYVSGQQGGNAAINFNFNCRDPGQMTFTQCKVPGWDYMAFDSDKGWVAQGQDQCGQNPILKAGGSPITGIPGTPCGQGGTCCDDSNQDNRPNVMDTSDGATDSCKSCCESVDNWQKDFNNNNLFSWKDATDNVSEIPCPKDKTKDETCVSCTDTTKQCLQCTKEDGTTKGPCTYQDIIIEGCSGDHVCIASTVDSDTADDQICKTCSQAIAKAADMSKATITFGNAQPLPYVGPNGVAITPSSGAPGFSDVRECQTSGSFEGQCQGLTGCAGTSNPEDIHPFNPATTTNTCANGSSYTGTSNYFTDPSMNCPNIFTLARNSDTSCPTDTNYDRPTGANPNLRNVDSIIIPEGAWVTAYWSPAQDDNWGDGQGLCAPPTSGQTKYVLQMGVGKYTTSDQSVSTQAVASIYTWTDDGKMTPLKDDSFTCLPIAGMTNGDNACAMNSDTITIKDNKDTTFTFSGFNKDILENVGESWGGWTFGFMPGYFNSTYITAKGPCGTSS